MKDSFEQGYRFSYIYLKRYLGGHYKCIFDEATGKYDKSKPHKHKIKDIGFNYHPHYIDHGICIYVENQGCMYGVEEKHLELPNMGYDSIG